MMHQIQIALLRVVPSPILRLVEGFWAVPLAISMTGIAMAIAVQTLPESWIASHWRQGLSDFDTDGTRTALSVIAGSMISTVALVFSLTFVALSITAQQLSPRILDIVLRERSAQALLGLALTTFLFGAITLTIGDTRGPWRLGLATPVAFSLAVATLILVVVFAHSMTRVMRAEEMVAKLGDKLVRDMHLLLDAPHGCRSVSADCEEVEREFSDATDVSTRTAGYVGVVDYEDLVTLATKRSLRLALDVREGEFLLPGKRVARVLGLDADDEHPRSVIERALNLSDRREASDTAEYDASALCETALRALSPGINDPATAMSCLNTLFEGLSVLAGAEKPPPRILAAKLDDEDSPAFLLRPSREVSDFIALAVVPIVAAARGDQRVMSHIGTLSDQLRALAHRPEDQSAIERLAKSLRAADT